MLAIAALTVAVVASPGEVPQSGADTILRMMSKYAAAKTLTGVVEQTTSLANSKVEVRIDIQYERSAKKVYVVQNFLTGSRKVLLLISDGKNFAFTAPRRGARGQDDKTLFVEPVAGQQAASGERYVLSFADIYNAASQSLAMSVAMDIVVGEKTHLDHLKRQLRQVTGIKRVMDGDELKHWVVSGKWRARPAGPPTGLYELWIAPDYTLVRYRMSEETALQGRIQQLVTDEVVKVNINAKPDDKLFRLSKKSG